jgi:hypothetical protein
MRDRHPITPTGDEDTTFRIQQALQTQIADAEGKAATANQQAAQAKTAAGTAQSTATAAGDLAATAHANIATVVETVPLPADAQPPSVEQTSRMGAATRRFARADHTHASSVQAQRVELTFDAAGLAYWTFPTAYPTGTVPVIEVTAETPAGATYKNDAGIVQGTATNTRVQIRMTRINATISAGGVLGLFAPVAGKAWVHVWARLPIATTPAAAPVKQV